MSALASVDPGDDEGSSATAVGKAESGRSGGGMQRILDLIERIGNGS